ncbi:MAG TPA: hypothetical protein VLF59_04845 [Candidatus Saccharimonadales bacterium]|nr:hypothetical protein [Candidatus Saccharimonadales bacterium]
MPGRELLSVAAVDLEHGGENAAGQNDLALYDLVRARNRTDPDFTHGLFDNLSDPKPQQGRVIPLIGNTALFSLGPNENGEYPRYDQTNLVLAHPKWNGNCEERRKAELVSSIYPAFDLVVARHGTRKPGLSYALCHEKASPVVWNAIRGFGMEHILHTDAPTQAGVLYNYLAIDLPPDSEFIATKIYDVLAGIATGEQFEQRRAIKRYQGGPNITIAAARKYQLPPMEPFEPFEPFGERAVAALGLSPGTVSITGSMYGQDPTWFSETGIELSQHMLAQV